MSARADLIPTVEAVPTGIAPRHPEPGVIDALALAAVYADEVLLGTARHTHQAVAERAFGLANRATAEAARVPQAIHDGVAGSIYGSLSLALRSAASGLTRVGARGMGHPHPAPAMTVRSNGRVVPLERDALRASFPRATDRVGVFLHGPGQNEGHWELERYQRGGTYGSRLEAASGWTPVYLRVDTSLPVAENGVALTALMQELVGAWPTDVRRISLVGHSTGGLILRAACAVATAHGPSWTDRLSDVVTLGTPHPGADSALGVHHSSPRIGDLERGLPELPALPHVRYRLVSAGLRSRHGLLGTLLGDLLGRRGTGTGSTRKALRLFPDADVLHVPRADQLALLNHPDVYRALERWLG